MTLRIRCNGMMEYCWNDDLLGVWSRCGALTLSATLQHQKVTSKQEIIFGKSNIECS